MQLWHKRNIARSPIHGRDPRKTVRCSTLSLGRRSVSCCPFPATGPGLALPDAKRQMSMPPRSVAQWLEHRSPKPGVGGSSPSTPAKHLIEIQGTWNSSCKRPAAACYPFATIFANACALNVPCFLGRFIRVPRGAECRINLGGGILLHSRQNVAVEVEGDTNLAVPQSFARNLDMRSRGKHVRAVSMPQIMEAIPGQGGAFNCQHPFMGDECRLH